MASSSDNTTLLAPKLDDDEYFYCSPEGFQKLATIYDPKDPQKHFNWTNDYTIEMPIRIKKSGDGSELPETLVEMFENGVKLFPEAPALSVKRNAKWHTLSYKQYYDECKVFGKSLIALGVTPYRSVNIIGFNSPEWVIAFYGSIFGYYLPVGVYTTNGPDACQYVAKDSDCEVVVVENQSHLDKYLQVLDSLPLLKFIIVYNGTVKNVPKDCKVKVFTWDEFMSNGRSYKATSPENVLENRMKKQKPGNCCTLVYTSGTTGMPKGVMLSHDNYTWTSYASIKKYGIVPGNQDRIVSYLPLSHVAAQIIDIVGIIKGGGHMYFADPSALQGSLVETLKEVRPTFFFSVPRVWEKIDEKLKEVAAQNGWLATKISTWAKSMGAQGTFAEIHGKKLPFGFGLAKAVVYNNVKKALGLDQARFLMYGAAPLSSAIREYFLSLNMYLISGYGMSECAGPECLSDLANYESFEGDFYNSTGAGISGTNLIIAQPDKDGNGEICYRGRNRFMGYFKNEEATRQTIDQDGFLHSGDVGRLDKFGNLTITGRIKELIITAGGENVAPVLIENIFKEHVKFISNAVVIGDRKKYLVMLLTLKFVQEGDKLTTRLTPEVLREFDSIGSQATTIEQAKTCPKIREAILTALKKTNEKAISRSQIVQKYAFLDTDFTIDAGDLTPTLKLKRNVVQKKYEALIESLYTESKL